MHNIPDMLNICLEMMKASYERAKSPHLPKIIVGVVACSAVENDDGDEGAELKEKVNLQKFSLNISPWSKMELF